MAVKKPKTMKRKGPAPRPQAKPKKKKVPSWQDSTYQKQMSYFNKLYGDFKAQQTRTKSEASTYYGTEATADKKAPDTKKKVKTGKTYTSKYWKDKKGKWHKRKKTKQKPSYKQVTVKGKVTKGKKATDGLYQRELAESRKRDIVDIADDHAARGMIHSGLYAQKRGDYEKEYGKQLGETNRQKAKKYGDIASEEKQYLREQELEKEKARLEAIRRRAAKTGSLV